MKNGQRSDAKNVEVKIVEEDRECDGGLRYERYGRVGVESRTTVKHRRSWRLLIENVVREK